MARKPTHAHEADNGLAEKILSGEAYRVEATEDPMDYVNIVIRDLQTHTIRLLKRIAVIEAYLVHLGKTMGHNGTPQFIPHGENDD